MWNALVEHAATGATVIVATHHTSLAARADREIRLTGDGRVTVRTRVDR